MISALGALPVVGLLVATEHGAVPRRLGETESFAHLSFGEERSPLELSVRVFLIDRRMVFARDFATLHHERDKRE